VGKRKEKEERRRDQYETVIKRAKSYIRRGLRDLYHLLDDPEYENKQSEIGEIIRKVIQEADSKLFRARLKIALNEKDPSKRKEKLGRLFPGKRLKRLHKEIKKMRKAEEKITEKIAEQISLLDR
jgi:hypothetical protein